MKNTNTHQNPVLPVLSISQFLQDRRAGTENSSGQFNVMEYIALKSNELSQSVGRRFSFDDNGGGYQGL
jgi:hypothetical protein